MPTGRGCGGLLQRDRHAVAAPDGELETRRPPIAVPGEEEPAPLLSLLLLLLLLSVSAASRSGGVCQQDKRPNAVCAVLSLLSHLRRRVRSRALIRQDGTGQNHSRSYRTRSQAQLCWHLRQRSLSITGPQSQYISQSREDRERERCV